MLVILPIDRSCSIGIWIYVVVSAIYKELIMPSLLCTLQCTESVPLYRVEMIIEPKILALALYCLNSLYSGKGRQ